MCDLILKVHFLLQFEFPSVDLETMQQEVRVS
jgi:hypothetical protein